MTQLIINHNGKISNKDAIKAVKEFMDSNQIEPPHANKLTICIDGQDLTVTELNHDNSKESPCSSVFEIKFY